VREPGEPLELGRDWAGLLHQGRILISIDRIVAGLPLREILSHESAHDVLLKTSQLGWAQLAVSTFAADPSPEGELRSRCAALLGLMIEASRFTHEATATFAAGAHLRDEELEAYRARHPRVYIAAAEALEWVRQRAVPDEAKPQVALAAGSLALSVPVVDEWQTERLHEPNALERWLAQSANRPDRRFPVLCRLLEARTDEELEQLARHGSAVAAAWFADATVDRNRISIAPVASGLAAHESLAAAAKTVLAPLQALRSLRFDEAERLNSALDQPLFAVPGLQPAPMSVVLTRTTATTGPVALYPTSTAELHGYPLAHVQHNSLDTPVPGVHGVGERPHPLRQGEAALWLVSPTRGGRACHLSAGRLREWLDDLADETTVCLRDGGFFFGVPIGEPRLRERRHVVLVQNRVPFGMLAELPVVGLDEERSDVTMTVLVSDQPDVSFLLLRPSAPWPVVIVPTAAVTVERMIDALTANAGDVRFSRVDPPDFFLTHAVTRDVIRVLTDFEGKPWPPELAEPADAEPTRPPAPQAGAEDVERLVEDAAAAWTDYEQDRSADRFAAVNLFLTRVLDSPLLDAVPIARRAEILEDAAGCYYAHFDTSGDVDALRRCVEIRRRLLAALPRDWPDRPLQLRLTGQCILRLWAATGDADDRVEGLRLLREGNAPGFT
jgi:hypothetical protein